MEFKQNPFTPSFGKIPLFMAGRDYIVSDLIRAFESDGRDPNLVSIFVGARGTGKTALMSYLAEAALSRGWISANVTAVPGMLEDIIERTADAAEHLIASEDTAKLKGISIGQLIGVEWERDERHRNWRTRMNGMLDQLGAYDVGLLITVDEVCADLDEMIQLAATFQHFVREDRKVALLMAGLPYKVSMLLVDKSVSFLRRAQYYRLGRIADYDIEDAFIRTIEQSGRTIEHDALLAATKASDGFPYMMQLVGYRMWAQNPECEHIALKDAERGIALAQAEIEDRILLMTYRELSEGDVKFLHAMLPDDDASSMADIAERLGVKRNYAAQYRKRLLEQGIIGERGRSSVGFELPLFKEFLQEHSDF